MMGAQASGKKAKRNAVLAGLGAVAMALASAAAEHLPAVADYAPQVAPFLPEHWQPVFLTGTAFLAAVSAAYTRKARKDAKAAVTSAAPDVDALGDPFADDEDEA